MSIAAPQIQSQERTRDLLSLAARLSGAVTPSEVADIIFRQGIEAVGADAASLAIMRTDGEKSEFEMIRSEGFKPETTRKYQFFPLHPGRPLSDSVISRAPVILETVDEWKKIYGEESGEQFRDEGYEAFIAMPIIAGETPLGGLTFSFREPRAVGEDERTFLETLGRLCAQALERSRAYEVAETAERRVSFLARASAELAASLDFQKTLDTVARLAVPELADCCFAFLAEDVATGTGRLVPATVHHPDENLARRGFEILQRFPMNPDSDFGSSKVFRTGEPLLASDIRPDAFDTVALDAEYLALLKAMAFRSSVHVPIKVRDLTVGVFTFASTDVSGRRYCEADLNLLLEVSARASVALENAQLYAAEREARHVAERAMRIAEEASRTKSQFLAVMSHELRTPLNAIGGYAQLLEIGVHGSMTDAQLEAIRRVKRSQQNLLALIEDLLTFAKLDTGKVEYRFASIPLDHTLSEIETLVKPQLDAKGLDYEYCHADPALTVWADRDKLEQIVLNLLTNAIKFTSRGGIRIECVDRGDTVDISVSDTGIGIAQSNLELIFDPFVQVNAGLTRTTTGSGLGLAISRDLAKAMGGDITVDSVEGEGSTFTLTLLRSKPG